MVGARLRVPPPPKGLRGPPPPAPLRARWAVHRRATLLASRFPRPILRFPSRHRRSKPRLHVGRRGPHVERGWPKPHRRRHRHREGSPPVQVQTVATVLVRGGILARRGPAAMEATTVRIGPVPERPGPVAALPAARTDSCRERPSAGTAPRISAGRRLPAAARPTPATKSIPPPGPWRHGTPSTLPGWEGSPGWRPSIHRARAAPVMAARPPPATLSLDSRQPPLPVGVGLDRQRGRVPVRLPRGRRGAIEGVAGPPGRGSGRRRSESHQAGCQRSPGGCCVCPGGARPKGLPRPRRDRGRSP